MFRLNGLSPFNIEKMAKQTILYNKRIIRLNGTFYTTDPMCTKIKTLPNSRQPVSSVFEKNLNSIHPDILKSPRTHRVVLEV